MPRRDGLPTNSELLLEFNAASHRAYVRAYDLMTATGLPDAYQDKPLKFLTVNFNKASLDGALPVQKEDLDITTLYPGDAEELPYNYAYARFPEEVLQRYVDAAEIADDITLCDDLVLGDVLPVEAIDAEYVLTYRDGRRRHIESYKDKPAKQSIVSGTYFANEAYDYLGTDEALIPSRRKITRALIQVALTGYGEQPSVMTHRFELRRTPYLPLNGHEPRGFLEVYAREMFAVAMRRGEEVAHMRERHAPDILVDIRQSDYELYHAAYERAQAILDSK